MEWGIAVEELGATGGGAAPVSAGIGPSNGGGPPFGKPPGIDGGCPSGEEVAKEPMPGGVPMPAPGEGFARGGIGPSSGLLCEGGGGAPIGLDGGCGLDESDGGALSGSGLPLRDGGPDGWDAIYPYAWFTGFIVAAVLYRIGMRRSRFGGRPS